MPDRNINLNVNWTVTGQDSMKAASDTLKKVGDDAESSSARVQASQSAAFRTNQRIWAENKRMAEAAAAADEKSQQAAFQTNQRIARMREAEAKSAARAEQAANNETFRMNQRIWAQEEEAIRRRYKAEQDSQNAAFRTNQRIWAEKKRMMEQEASDQRRLLSMGASSLGIGGGGLSRGLTAGGMLGGAMLGVGAAVGLGAMVKDAAEGARNLQNLAEEMNITAAQAYKLQAAANLTGISMGSVSQGARRLAQAVEEPGGAGKKTALALAELGVNIREGLGGTFTDAIEKLNAMADGEKKVALEAQIFGKDGVKWGEFAKQIHNVGQSLDEDVQKNLLEANATLKDFGNSWTIAEGKAVSFFMSTNKLLQMQTSGLGSQMWTLYGAMLSPKQAPFKRQGPMPPAGDSAKTMALIGDLSSRQGIEEQVANAKESMDKAVTQGLIDAKTKASEPLQEADRAAITKTRDEYNRLKALLKKPKKDRGPNEQAEIEARLRREELQYEYPPILYGEVGTRMAQASDDMEAIRRKQHITPAQRASDIKRQQALNDKRIQESRDNLRTTQIERQADFDKASKKELDKNYKTQIQSTDMWFGTSLKEGSEAIKDDRAMRQLNVHFQAKQMEDYTRAQNKIQNSNGEGGISGDYKNALDLAKQLYTLREADVDKESDAAKQALENTKAKYELISAQQEAQYEREEKIAAVARQQREEMGTFTRGMFEAGMSGQSGAMSNFFSSFGKNIASTAIGNAGSALLPSFNRVFSLGHTGALGKSDSDRNFLGKLVKGTPFDWSAEDLKKMDGPKTDPLIESQKHLIDAINANTSAWGGRVPASAAGTVTVPTVAGSSGGGSILTSISRVLGAPGGTAPFLAAGSTAARGAANLAGMGSSGGIANLIQDGISIPLSALGGHSVTVSGVSDPVATQSADVAGGSSLSADIQDNSDYGIGASDLAQLAGPSAGPNANSPVGRQLSTFAKAANAISGTISGLFSGASTVMGGHALSGILTGGIDNGDGTGMALSGTQRIGAAAGLAGGTYAGISTAVKDFGRGGGRGISQGIGASLGTAAMYDPDPISHTILSSGAAIAGLVSSFFGDPVAEKKKQIEKAQLYNAMIEPGQHQYSYSASGNGGVDFGADGSMRSGAKQANYTVNVQAMSAKTFADTFQDNRDAFGSNLSQVVGESGVANLAQIIAYRAAHP